MLMVPLLAAAQTSVQIVVKGDSVDSMQPSDLYSDTPYNIKVTVLDANGNPKAGATVTFGVAGGAVAIDGNSSATTGGDGVATISLTFSAGGIVKLFVGDTRVMTLTVLYRSPPIGALSVISILLLVLLATVGYTLYIGPLKWLRGT